MSNTQFEDTDIQILRGDDNLITFSIVDNSTSLGFNLTGYTVRAQGRAREDSPDWLYDTASTSGMTLSNGSNGSSFPVGKVVLKITQEIARILPTHHRYDIRAYSSGRATTLARGMATLIKDITRD